jgi:signal transduction histidine kinase
MMRQSLRARTERAMLRPLAVVILGVLVLAGVSSFFTISAQRDQLMQQSALLVHELSRHEAAERDQLGSVPSFSGSSVQQDLGVGMEYRVWSDLGTVAQSKRMPAIGRTQDPGFHNVMAQGMNWRVLVLGQADSAMSVEIAEPMALRLRETALVVFSLALPLALLVLAVVAIGRRGIAQSLAPLTTLSQQVDRRDADDLTLIETRSLDFELRPLADALNRLLARLDNAFSRERAFSDNAAHELRTPLATIRLRSQVIASKLQADAAFQKDAAQFQQAVDRASKVVDHLLCLARLEHQERLATTFDLTACIEDVIAQMAPEASAKEIELSAELADAAAMRGDEVAVAMAVRNLLENAIKFTPANGMVDLRLKVGQGQAVLSVRDNGPGLVPGDEQRVFERFYRGSSAIPGSGLGLALVSAVARLHGGSVTAKSVEPQGSEFTLTMSLQ